MNVTLFGNTVFEGVSNYELYRINMGPEFNALDSVKHPCKVREIWRCNDIWSEGHVMMDTETAETQLQVHEAFLETTGRVTNISKPTRKEPEWRLDYNFCKIPLTFDSSLDPVCLSGSQPRVRPDGQSLSSEHWKAVKKQTKTTSTLPLLFRDLGIFFFFWSIALWNFRIQLSWEINQPYT